MKYFFADERYIPDLNIHGERILSLMTAQRNGLDERNRFLMEIVDYNYLFCNYQFEMDASNLLIM